MTIIKAQGQTLQRCGINLTDPCFAHGQLFVALSRATKMSGIKIYQPYVYPPKPGDPPDHRRVKNIVVKEILQ
jgi:hypothetical protein